ncbi:serine hydrolase domain-containing protein [Paludisphaera mucosa]|uniref:Serine hydrolase n=1 Tax=Paludisphaera mucosa TaxID=3030827 RepID=A0ABT6F4M8_9BACT|nr:serine hydrolase domain-containing protein [Paludisphaera mucosa]MDG3002474.1 serine hydrolase [Paludisphaera mucosa]
MRRFLAFLLLLVPTSAFAQAPVYLKAEAVDAVARAEIDKQRLVGVAVVVLDKGEIAWAKGYGFADREAVVAVDPATTQFRWASIAKPVTAVAALQLVEKGRLDLDADVRSYVPEFPDKGVKITPRQLLCHQGGIVHYANGEVLRIAKEYDVEHPFADVVTALDMFKMSPLIARPGERFSYSTHGYILLSAVVERAGKERYADQVRERIAGPLGMTSFRPDYQWEEIPNRAVGYMRHEGMVDRRPDELVHDVSWKLGGGGFTSTATDLARFGVGLLQRKLVSEETERLMWTVNKPVDPQGAKPYGYGFFVIERPDGTKLVGHDGSQEKARTGLVLDLANRRGIAVMTNSEWADAMSLAMHLLDAIK